jgi:hypothetical protein
LFGFAIGNVRAAASKVNRVRRQGKRPRATRARAHDEHGGNAVGGKSASSDRAMGSYTAGWTGSRFRAISAITLRKRRATQMTRSMRIASAGLEGARSRDDKKNRADRERDRALRAVMVRVV